MKEPQSTMAVKQRLAFFFMDITLFHQMAIIGRHCTLCYVYVDVCAIHQNTTGLLCLCAFPSQPFKHKTISQPANQPMNNACLYIGNYNTFSAQMFAGLDGRVSIITSCYVNILSKYAFYGGQNLHTPKNN